LWLAACSAKVWEASPSKVSTTLLESTFAVAAVPGSLTLPSSEDSPEHFPVTEPSASVSAALEGPSSPSPSADEASCSEELDEASDSEVPSLVRVAATDGSVPALDLREAAELLALSSADSSADAAADLLAELSGSGSEGTSDRDACSMDVAAAEELALGEELAESSSESSSLEDIATGPKRGLGLRSNKYG